MKEEEAVTQKNERSSCASIPQLPPSIESKGNRQNKTRKAWCRDIELEEVAKSQDTVLNIMQWVKSDGSIQRENAEDLETSLWSCPDLRIALISFSSHYFGIIFLAEGMRAQMRAWVFGSMCVRVWVGVCNDVPASPASPQASGKPTSIYSQPKQTADCSRFSVWSRFPDAGDNMHVILSNDCNCLLVFYHILPRQARRGHSCYYWVRLNAHQ